MAGFFRQRGEVDGADRLLERSDGRQEEEKHKTTSLEGGGASIKGGGASIEGGRASIEEAELSFTTSARLANS